MKICPVGVELFRADGQTDMMKLIVAFRNFANTPENVLNTINKISANQILDLIIRNFKV